MPQQSREPFQHEDGPAHAPETGVQHSSPDDLDYHHALGSRLYLSARQRGVDATALGQLALYLPGLVLSLAMIVITALLLQAGCGLPFWIPTLLWLASGVLVFHHPTEALFARHVLKLRYPLPEERVRLEPVWREVTGRSGVDGSRYRLWVEDSGELNAYAAAGHIVGVTRYALGHLSSAQLAAVLAHELGHHTGGHSWSGLLGQWYALPGRAACRAGRVVLLRTMASARRTSCLIALILTIGLAIMVLGSALAVLATPLLLLALPYAMAALSRRAELRADRHAASLGFAPMLVEALQFMEDMETGPIHAPVQPVSRGTSVGPGPLTHLLDSHPDHATRLHHLRPYLEPPR
ncbi:M48 family metalloprotease [Streptomyces sp. NPDC058008]|uniref:M48 family metalloprotease n=1 Tax=Streptomyces sp. NPDC058008 TaxID=3346303 RepID=UPI0036E5F7A6